MNKRDYEVFEREALIELIEELEEDNEKLKDENDDLRDDLDDLNESERLLAGECEELEDRIAELEEEIESNGATKSRNFTIDNLYYLLCDRYGVSHHTSKDKLKALVDEELSL